MITSRNSSEMSQLNEISYFFLCKKFLPFTDFFQKHFASSHEVSQLLTTRVPWSQRFFLIFLCERDQEQAAKRRQGVAKATRRERKTSGYLDLESHFHADDRVRI